MGESKEDVVDMLLELREIQPEALPINFLLPIPGTPLGDADISELTTEYCTERFSALQDFWFRSQISVVLPDVRFILKVKKRSFSAL